jgi:hypothetical protein
MDAATCLCGEDMPRVAGDLYACGVCGRVWEFSGGFFTSLAAYGAYVHYQAPTADPAITAERTRWLTTAQEDRPCL